MARRDGRLLLVLCSLLVVGDVYSQDVIECGECDSAKCPPVENCPGAQALDICGCCQVCKRSLGQRCDINPILGVTYGPCGEYLKCTPRVDISDSNEATCECVQPEEVCGSDGITYSTMCHLLSQIHPNLTVQRQGPCLSKPHIKTPPMSSTRALGGILVLDCEAIGVPVPSISWELLKPNGESVKLPNDDSGIAVQIRGGPEPHMITGWVQIMRVTKENIGTYICRAENSQGYAMETAKITYLEEENELY